LSGCPKTLALKNTKHKNIIKNAIKLKVSFKKKYGKNDILSFIEAIPKGLFEPS
jgi:hypothetical protein